MAAVRFANQYDKRSYLRARLHHRWNSLTRPGEFRSDTARLERIEALAEEMKALRREDILQKTREWMDQAAAGQLKINAIIEPAFALVREASRRSTGLFHYPEQILSGLIQVRGGVAEMATGEGKTLAVSLPAYVFALFGRGVHVVTVNSYLAERDHEFGQPLFEYMGLSTGLLPEGQAGTPPKKRAAYQADVTYGTGYEFGFDYLRDQLALMKAPRSGAREKLRNALLDLPTADPPVVQRGLRYAIIDEVDSVLIDEAGSPLVISEAAPGENPSAPVYQMARDVASSLEIERHFEIDTANRSLTLTREGFELVHETPGIPWDLLRRPWQHYVLNALRAEHFFHRDIHYVVDDEDGVVIIDEFTGRRFTERTWRDGLHQAVEAGEHQTIRPETDSSASITRQRYFALYDNTCGLTGTAAESAGEFWHFFHMPVEPVPLHKPSRRKVEPERIFNSQEAMYAGVVREVARRTATGQPILVGTRTIRASEALAVLMEEAGIDFRLLTAKQDEEESEIVALAGEENHVLLATNMAGRGTHIGLSKKAEAAGGLHVIAVERNESVRIDRQLIGRGARQGQPGGAQFFVSADDHLIVTYAEDLAEQMRKAKADEYGELESRWSSAFDEVQAMVERRRYAQRLRMAERDKWLDEIKTNLA